MRAPEPLLTPHDVPGPALGLVLVVETHPTTAEMTLLVLSLAGYDTVRVATGQLAVAAASRWTPDLVLLDPSLPDVPGTQLCRQLRRQCPAPIVVVSTATESAAIDDALAAGACDYLRKPFRTGELLTRIQHRLAG